MKAFQKIKRFTVEVIILIIFMGTATAIAQTWQNTDGPWFVSNGTALSVGQKVAVGYTGGTRVIYDAAYGDSVLRATGSLIRWSNKPIANPRFAACEAANPSTVYTGVVDVGLFKSVNSGDSWTPINNRFDKFPLKLFDDISGKR
ncbi:MAG TPA: hypothetical protein VFG32_11440 [Bacteroidota bacterium]|nr:hypothetical protein [Bacteroidota bacterium]